MDLRSLLFSNALDIDSLDQRDEETIRRVAHFAELMSRYHRATVCGVEHVPEGPALYVGNHNGGIMTVDSYIFVAAVYRAHGLDAVPYGLGHEWAIRLRGAHTMLSRLGAVRASHENAQRIFERGNKALVYPGGDVDAFRSFRRRNEVVFGGRRGYIRLALRSGVSIVPVVTHGAHATWLVLSDGRRLAKWLGLDQHVRVKVMPISLSFPLGLSLGIPVPYVPFPTRINIKLLPAITFARSGEVAANDEDYVSECASEVETTMQSCLSEMASKREHR